MTEEWFKKMDKIPYFSESGISEDTAVDAYEKLDGSNAGFLLKGDRLLLHSRRRLLGYFIKDGRFISMAELGAFKGFVDYIGERLDESITLAKKVDGNHVYGEWLVPHTVKYDASMYNKFYIFPVNNAHAFKSDAFEYVELVLSKVPASSVVGFDFDSLGRPIEGLVAYIGNQPVFKSVHRLFQENHRVRNKVALRKKANANDGLAGAEELAFLYFPYRSIVKAYEKVADRYGAVNIKNMKELLHEVERDYFTEHFYRAILNEKIEQINVKRLKKMILDVARDAFLVKFQTGNWPMWLTSKVSRDNTRG